MDAAAVRKELWLGLFVLGHLSFYLSALQTDHLQHLFMAGTIQAEKTLDYSQIPNGARTLFEGDPLGVRGRKRPYPVLNNVYHPVTTVLLGGFLQLFDIPTGFVVFTAIKLAMTGVLALLLYRRYRESPNFTLAAFVFLLFAPQAVDIACGQYHFLLDFAVFLLCWGLLHAKSDRWLTSAYLASLLVKPIGLLWAPNLWLAGKRRVAVVALGLFVGLTAAGSLLPGGDYYLDQLLFHAESPIQQVKLGVPQDGGRYTLEALIRFAGGGVGVTQALKFALIPVLLAIGWVFRLPLFTILFTWVVYYLLFYGRVYIYHYATLIPFLTLGLLTQRAFQTRTAKVLIVLLSLPSPYLLFKLAGVFVEDFGHPVHQRVSATGYVLMACLRVLPALALGVCVVAHEVRGREWRLPELRFEPKRLVFALLPSLAIVVLVIAAAEASLRLRHPSPESLSGVTDWKTARWKDLVYHWDIYHPSLGWTNLPGYRSDARIPFEVRINSQGLRALREYAPLPPAGRQRVLVFGDSSVFGEEVDDDETLPFYLEQELPGSEVLNFGVHGYGLGQVALRLEEEGFAANPDRVVVVYLTYSFVRDLTSTYLHAKPAFRVEAGKLLVDNVPVPETTRQPWLLRSSYLAAWTWGRQQRQKPAGGRDLEASLEVMARILARIRSACEARGVPLTLVHIVDGPTLEAMQSDPRERHRVHRIRKELAASGIDTLDLAPSLEISHRLAGDSLLAPHGHWSARGNRLIAGEIARHLAD